MQFCNTNTLNLGKSKLHSLGHCLASRHTSMRSMFYIFSAFKLRFRWSYNASLQGKVETAVPCSCRETNSHPPIKQTISYDSILYNLKSMKHTFQSIIQFNNFQMVTSVIFSIVGFPQFTRGYYFGLTTSLGIDCLNGRLPDWAPQGIQHICPLLFHSQHGRATRPRKYLKNLPKYIKDKDTTFVKVLEMVSITRFMPGIPREKTSQHEDKEIGIRSRGWGKPAGLTVLCQRSAALALQTYWVLSELNKT